MYLSLFHCIWECTLVQLFFIEYNLAISIKILNVQILCPSNATLGIYPIDMLVKVKVAQSCLTFCNSMDYNSPWNSPGQNTGVGSLSLLQGIFPTQGSNPSLPHCRWILYHLRPQGSPKMLYWVAYPFSRGSSQPRNQTRVSCITGRFFTT